MSDFRDEQGSGTFAGITRGLWPIVGREEGKLTREFLAWERFVKALVISEIRRLWLAVFFLKRAIIATGNDRSEGDGAH